jgi:membrane protein required for colicin V production
MEVYDLIMLVVLAIATLFGAWKGLAWQVASISSIFVSYFVACNFRDPVSAAIKAKPPWNTFLAMLILYLGCSLAIWVAFRLVSNVIDRVRLKEFDRHAGAVLGFTRGVLWCVIITLFAVTLLGEAQQRSIINSRSGYYIALLLDGAHAVMPEEIHQVLAPYIHSLDERLDTDQRWSQQHAGTARTSNDSAENFGSGFVPMRIGDQPEDENDAAIQRWLQKLPQMHFDNR